MAGRRFRKDRGQSFDEATPDLIALADAWIALQRATKQEHEALFWAWESIHGLVDRDPETAWRVIDLIWRRDQDDWILANLAAGPVEDLLARHGPAFIDRIYLTARREPVFRKLLGGVWGRNRIAAPVWQRLKEIAGPPF